MAQGTLLDIAKLNGADKVVGLIEQNMTYAPEFSVVPARTIRGTSYKTVSRDTFPGVGFRNANAGVTYTKSTFLTRTHECYIFSGNVRVDVAVANAYEDGPEAYKSIEASGVMKQALIDLGSQFFYGTASDSKGFPGLYSFWQAFCTELEAVSIAALEVDAGGSSATTGSSVYAVKFGVDGVQFILGNNSGITLGDWFQQMVNDGTAGQDYLADVASMNAWVGLQAANPYCIGRIRDCTADAGKGLTDSLVEDLLAKFPVGYKPDALFMTRRSRRQLQQARSVYLSSGVPQISGANAAKLSSGRDVQAPIPTEAGGIPIICTDSLTNVETLDLT